MQTRIVLIDPRFGEMEYKGVIKLEKKFIRRAEIAYDELVNRVVYENIRGLVNTT